ncbi:hypothetical protein SEA_A3WALLY_224 [Microbacterium phage A3Wally]|nr:hypothetical protein SEA_A3WALLY_224 [Microbacterium phage A3Wally]
MGKHTTTPPKVPWYKTNFPVQNFLFQYMPWTCIIRERIRTGYEWSWLIKTYVKAKGGWDEEWGYEETKIGSFYYQLAVRADEESTYYACVYGCCTVIWHPKHGNKGGAGRPGCPCQNMDDPRDLERGPLK